MTGDLPSVLILTFIVPGWVFKFLCMIYEDHIIWKEKQHFEINYIFWKIKEIMQHVMKMQ